ncbi:hypothetical protein D3C72_814050 [compost metagenome]
MNEPTSVRMVAIAAINDALSVMPASRSAFTTAGNERFTFSRGEPNSLATTAGSM